MIIDIEEVNAHENVDATFVVVLQKTGVFYRMQVNGMSCSQLMPEGIAFVLPEIDDFDDCSYGCSYIDGNIELQKKLATAIEGYFGGRDITFMKFDWERISELMEGFWPIQYQIEGKFYPAIMHAGNCD